MAGGILISNALDQNLGDKIMNKRIRLLILTSFVYASPGLAEEQGKPASLAAQGSASPAAAVQATTNESATNSGKTTEIKPEKSLEASKEKLRSKASQKEIDKYKSKVALAIASQARKQGSVGNGYAAISFRIAENGVVTGVVVRSSSSPKHAETARRIVSGIHAGPPPGGEISLNPRFQFQ
jgi:hypothetical protein